jgi:hypothetical protein
MASITKTPVDRRGWLLIAGLTALLAASVVIYVAYIREPGASVQDPRLTYATPFLNVRPDVQYVGDEACASCHTTIVESYRQHSMGRSVASVSAVPASGAYPEQHGPEARNPFSVLELRYSVERGGPRMLHREEYVRQGKALTELASEVHYAVGAGSRGRSYLICTDGYVFQSPITWYPLKKRWDLSPGYEKENPHFDRPVHGLCLFCHTNRVEPVAHTTNRYQEPLFRGEAIGCERCHGPGGLHVERQERRDGMDVTIVNPKHLKPALREAVCEQCHLEGAHRVLRRGRDLFDYRPGLPLEEFIAVYVKPKEQAGDLTFVGHVEQMHASQCFQASKGRMGCITCHDPHSLPGAAERVAFHRQRCLQCHDTKGCSEPLTVRRSVSPEDSCIQCHMPDSKSEILHAAVTDHRILRRAQAVKKEPAPAAGEGKRKPFVLFHANRATPDDKEAARDYAVAVAEVAELEGFRSLRVPGAARQEVAKVLLPLARPAAQRDPRDLPAQEAEAVALWMNDQPHEAAAVYQRILRSAGQRESALRGAAALAHELRQPDQAARLWRRAIAVSPYRWEYHHRLGAALAEQSQWQNALEACRDAARLNPLALESRKLIVACYLEMKEGARAEAEYRLLLDLNPPDRQALEQWYELRTRGVSR